jgi:hypothetical protein
VWIKELDSFKILMSDTRKTATNSKINMSFHLDSILLFDTNTKTRISE